VGVKKKMTDIVGKLWGFCHTLRHDGIDYGDYIEQLTYLLFLKMIEEKGVEIPLKYFLVRIKRKVGSRADGSLFGYPQGPGRTARYVRGHLRWCSIQV
jgi:hypothetical protein